MFHFGARDVWFVVALPEFLSSVLGWEFWQAGGFMALWVIGYGMVQATASIIMRSKADPTGGSATWLAFTLVIIAAGIATALHFNINPSTVVVTGLIMFGIVFALNSALHSFLILAYTDRDKVALNVGIYYMANACGRLAAPSSPAGSTRSAPATAPTVASSSASSPPPPCSPSPSASHSPFQERGWQHPHHQVTENKSSTRTVFLPPSK